MWFGLVWLTVEGEVGWLVSLAHVGRVDRVDRGVSPPPQIRARVAAGTRAAVTDHDLGRVEIPQGLLHLIESRCLGGGTSGEVFVAMYGGTEVGTREAVAGLTPCQVAAKRARIGTSGLAAPILAAFRREVLVHSSLRHPCVVGVYGACTQGRELIVVMELMPGNLRTVLDKQKGTPLSVDIQCRVLTVSRAGGFWTSTL